MNRSKSQEAGARGIDNHAPGPGGGAARVSWPLMELGQVAEITGGATPRRDNPAYWGGDVLWLTPTDLPPVGAGVTDVAATADAITEEGLAACSANLLPPGTVLFSSRASIGKVGIAAIPLTTNQGFANLIPRKGVEPRYLAWCLHFHAERIAGLAGSTTFKEVTKSALKRFRIPLPPPSEQRRIVEILDQADHLRRLRAEADVKADRILPALFIKMFGDPVSLTGHPQAKPLSSFDLHLQNGFACGEKDVEEGLRHLRMNNIADSGELDLNLVRTVPRTRDTKRYRLRSQDILFMSTNSEEKVGKACVFPGNASEHCLFSNHLVRIRIDDGRLVPEYVASYLHLLWQARYFTGIAKRWVNQSTVTVESLRRLTIVAFPAEQQFAFAATRQSLRIARERSAHSGTHLNRIFGTLLSCAFSGELTARWREGHMAELLRETEHQAKSLAAPARGD